MAFQRFKSLKLGGRFDDLLAATRNYALAMDGKEQDFIAHPTTFLNKGYWEDYITQVSDSEKIANGAAKIDNLSTEAKRLLAKLSKFNVWIQSLTGEEQTKAMQNDNTKTILTNGGGLFFDEWEQQTIEEYGGLTQMRCDIENGKAVQWIRMSGVSVA